MGAAALDPNKLTRAQLASASTGFGAEPGASGPGTGPAGPKPASLLGETVPGNGQSSGASLVKDRNAGSLLG